MNKDPSPGTHEPGYVEQRIVQRAVPPQLRRDALRLSRGLSVFSMGECNIILGREPAGVHGELRWHLTISCPDRHPSWDEIKTARYRLMPLDVAVAMILPPPAFYVNLEAQGHVFQLWEIEDESRVWETM